MDLEIVTRKSRAMSQALRICVDELENACGYWNDHDIPTPRRSLLQDMEEEEARHSFSNAFFSVNTECSELRERKVSVGKKMFENMYDATTTQRKIKTLRSTLENGKTSEFNGITKLKIFLARFETMVRSYSFEACFCFLIVANTTVMSLEAQYDGLDTGYHLGVKGYCETAERAWPGGQHIFLVFDWIFGIVFTIELVLKKLALGINFVKDPWNWLDFVIVLAWLVTAASNADLFLKPSQLRLIRLVRLLRMLRILRTLQGFDSLFLMTTAIKASVQALGWSMVLLFLFMVMTSMFMTQMLAEMFFLNDDVGLEERLSVYRYFGTFTMSFLTMFELSVANWIPVSRTLCEDVSEWMILFVVPHKLVMGFAVVMVITGVFLRETFNVAETDDTIMRNRKERDNRYHQRSIQRVWQAADRDNNQAVDLGEFTRLLRKPKVAGWLATMGIGVDDVQTLFQLIDDGDGLLTSSEFVVGVLRLRGTARSADLALFMYEQKKLETLVELIQTRLSDTCKKLKETQAAT